MGCALCGRGVPVKGPNAGPARCDGCVTSPTTREDRLRRMAERQGLVLSTSRRGENRLYWLTAIAGRVGQQCHRLLVSPDAGMTLDGVEEYLTYGMTRAEIMQYLIRSYGPQFVEELIKRLPGPSR